MYRFAGTFVFAFVVSECEKNSLNNIFGLVEEIVESVFSWSKNLFKNSSKSCRVEEAGSFDLLQNK